MSKFAWVTLATNDSYSLGALVVASSLKRVNTAHELVVLVTPGVSESMKSKLRSVFNLVEEVNVLDSQDAAHLALLKRPELGITFTKLHCWRLTQYDKCVFLDADTLILQNSDELFEREELSAAPDVGWPDCFNSGVFVYRPSLDTFGKLVDFATTKGSFDGGDQGLLNQYFNDWATKDITKRLPFIYNTTTTAVYSYIPAFKQFGDNLKILHFIGNVKPWLLNFDPQSKTVQSPSGYQHITTFLQLWWTIFCDDVHSNLSPEMNRVRSSYGSTEKYQPYTPVKILYVPPTFELLPNPKPNNCNTEKEINYYDPWENVHKNNTSDNYNINNNQNPLDNCNNITKNSNESVYEEIRNNLEVDYNYLPEQLISIDHNESHTNNALDDNSQSVVFSPPNAFLIPSPSAQKLSSEISFAEANNIIQTESNILPDGIDIIFNKININMAMEVSDPLPENQDDNISSANESGIAGALAKLTLGVNRSPEQEAFENHMRRQCWESGNIDYLGKDSFDNIWRRITQTIESGKQDFPTSSQPEPTTQAKSTSLSEEKLKVDITSKVPLRALDENDGQLNPNERNVIAVCSPHELMRSLSSPGLAQEQIITTVLPNGKTVQQKILTFPEREIVIEDYERIEILGPITRKITTETTRIISGKENQTEVVVRTEIHPQDAETNPIIAKQQTVTLNTPSAPPQIQPQQTQTNQNQTVAINPTNSPKISITDVLKPLLDDKVEFDSINNVTTITRKTTTGYEMIIATVTPDGRNHVQTKTFFNPVEICGTEEIEETYTEEHITEEGKKVTTTTSNVPIAKPNSATPSVLSTTTNDERNLTNSSQSEKVEIVEIVVNGRKGVKTTTTERTVTGSFITKTKIIYEDGEEEEMFEETEIPVDIEEKDKQIGLNQKDLTSIQTVEITNNDTSKSRTQITEKNNTTSTISETSTTNSTTTNDERNLPNSSQSEKVEIVEIVVNGRKGVKTTTTERTVTGSFITKTKIIYEDGEEEEMFEETEIPVDIEEKDKQIGLNQKDLTSIQTVEITNNDTSKSRTQITEETNTTSTISETSTVVVAPIEEKTNVTIEKTEVQTKTFYDPDELPREEVEIENIEETTIIEPVVKTKITTKSTTGGVDQTISDAKLESTEESEKVVTTTVTGVITNAETTEETTVTSNESISKPRAIIAPQSQVPFNEKPEATTISTTEVVESTNTETQIVSAEDKRVVTIEKTPTGHKEITTITTPDGLTKVQTKTFYDSVETSGEEVTEEYEETTTTEPVVTTKTTTTTSSTPSKPTDSVLAVNVVDGAHTQIKTEEITEETMVTTTSTKGVTTNEEVVEESTVISTEIPSAVITKKPNGNNETSTVIIEETITTENFTTSDEIPVKKTSETLVDTCKSSAIDSIQETTVKNFTGVESNAETIKGNTIIDSDSTVTDNTLTKGISKTLKETGQVTIESKSSEEVVKIYEETRKTEPTVTMKTTINAIVPTIENSISKSKDISDTTNSRNVSNKKIDTTKTSTVESGVTSTKTKVKTSEAEETSSVTIEKTPTGHKEITTIVSANGEIRVRTKTFYDPVEQEEEEEEIEEYEETHTSTPVVTTTQKISSKDQPLAETASNTTKIVTETETTIETLNVKTPQKLDKQKTTLQKVEKATGAVTTSVIGQETITTKTKTTATDITVKQQSEKSTSTSEKTKSIKDMRSTAGSEKKSVVNTATKTKPPVTTKTQQVPPQGEPQTIVTTKRIENGTEHTITTIFPDGTKKIEKKTFFDEVEVSGDEEEEEYEEYEEIEEEPIKTDTNKPSKAVPAPVETGRKKLIPPASEPKPPKEDSQFQPSKLKIPAAFASANAPPSGPVRPLLRKAAPKSSNTSNSSPASGSSSTKDGPVAPPRKKEASKLFKTSMLLLLLISLALIYNHCLKRKS